MGIQPDAEVEAESWYVSTGHLPSPAQIQHWVDKAHERYRSITDGENAQIYPALSRVPSDLFGICAVGTSGNVHAAGDAALGLSLFASEPEQTATPATIRCTDAPRRPTLRI